MACTAKPLRRRRGGKGGACHRSWFVDETSYEGSCVKRVPIQCWPPSSHSLPCWRECRGGAACGEGRPRQPRVRRGCRPRHDPVFGSEELRGERRRSTLSAL